MFIENDDQIHKLYSQAIRCLAAKEFKQVSALSKDIAGLAGLYWAEKLNAMILEAKNLLNLAIKKYLTTYQLAQKRDNNELISEALNNIGRCYGKMENYGMSIEYFEQSLTINPENVKALNNLGVANMRRNNNEKALQYLLKSYPICYREGLTIQTGINLGNIAALYMRINQLDKAQTYLQKAEKIAVETDNPELKCSILSQRGHWCLLADKIECAKKYLEKALNMSQLIADRDIEINCIGFYIELFKKIENYEKAYKYQNMLIKLKEHNHKLRLESKVSELRSQFEIGLREQAEKKRALEREKLKTERRLNHLQEVYSNNLEIGNLGIFSDTMRRIIDTADKLHFDRNIPTLIEGDTGTGKEVIARIIHFGKEKNATPFISINCSAISPKLFESELFGYEKGSFSGAKKNGQIGKMELAQKGTLFFDEIGELSLELQAKLLRAIQQKEIFKINGLEPIKLDVRFIFATNRKLSDEIDKGNFRLDLFHRLNSGYIYIPPLSERIDEIAPLAQMFLLQYAKKKNSNFQYIDPEAVKILEQYKWQGNVRELKNAIERIVLLHNDYWLSPKHLSFLSDQFPSEVKDKISGKYTIKLPEESIKLDDILDEVIRQTYNHFEGNITRTAKLLNISRTKVYRKIKS